MIITLLNPGLKQRQIEIKIESGNLVVLIFSPLINMSIDVSSLSDKGDKDIKLHDPSSLNRSRTYDLLFTPGALPHNYRRLVESGLEWRLYLQRVALDSYKQN